MNEFRKLTKALRIQPTYKHTQTADNFLDMPDWFSALTRKVTKVPGMRRNGKLST
jgi:hypothetical protein